MHYNERFTSILRSTNQGGQIIEILTFTFFLKIFNVEIDFMKSFINKKKLEN